MFGGLLGKKDPDKIENERIKQAQTFEEKQLLTKEASGTTDIDLGQNPQSTYESLRYTQGVEDEICQAVSHELKNEILIETDKGSSWAPLVVGYTKDKNGNEEPVFMPPKINDYGVMTIITMVRPFVNRNLFNSNFGDKQISSMISQSRYDLLYNLIENKELYGLGYMPSITNIGIIMTTYANYIRPGPYRAYNDGERKNWRTQNKRIETLNSSPPQQKTSGFFSRSG